MIYKCISKRMDAGYAGNVTRDYWIFITQTQAKRLSLSQKSETTSRPKSGKKLSPV